MTLLLPVINFRPNTIFIDKFDHIVPLLPSINMGDFSAHEENPNYNRAKTGVLYALLTEV